MIRKGRLVLVTVSILVLCMLSPGAADERSAVPTGSAEVPAQLQDYVKEALAKNPEIQAARFAVDSKRAHNPQTRPWPDSTVTAGNTDTEALNYEVIQRRIAAEVKQAYLDLCLVNQSLSTLRENRDLLQKLTRLAEARYASGKGAQQDMVRAQMEISKILERLTIAGQTRQTIEARLNSLRNLPLDTPVGKTEKASLSVPGYSVEQLTEAAIANDPDLRRQRAEESRLATDRTKKTVHPGSKQDQAVAEAEVKLRSLQAMQASATAKLRYRIKREYLEIQASARLARLYSETIIPQATLAVESSVSSYDEGTTDFLSLITNFETKLDYELNCQQQIINHEKALARIEEVTGLTLIQ